MRIASSRYGALKNLILYIIALWIMTESVHGIYLGIMEVLK